MLRSKVRAKYSFHLHIHTDNAHVLARFVLQLHRVIVVSNAIILQLLEHYPPATFSDDQFRNKYTHGPSGGEVEKDCLETRLLDEIV